MKTHFFIGLGALLTATVQQLAGTPEEAVLLHLGDDLEQVRIEAQDPDSGRWLAIASGYRDKADSGWLKVALPAGYENAEIRVLGSEVASPFAGSLSPLRKPDPQFVSYPPAPNNGVEFQEDVVAAGEGVMLEEADIWSWDDTTLYFYNQYRGLQVIDMSDPLEPQWKSYFRYPAKGEDLYSLGEGKVLIIGTGNYWSDNPVALQFLAFDGSHLTLEDTVELEAGDYVDSRRYNDYLYVMTREWVEETDPDGRHRNAPLIRLYSVSLLEGVEDRVVDVQSFKGNGWLDAVLTAQPDGILLCLNKWNNNDEDSHRRWRSEVNVLVPGDDGVPELVGSAPVSGIIHDKFKLKFSDGILTTLSQKADWSTGQFFRETTMENFRLGESGFNKIGSLDLAPGEILFASRFYQDNVYVVTFQFVDPLFAIDNSDPTLPSVVGELEVPGWSNYIEWVDDQLFAVGIEDSRLTVSVFDVADPTDMSLKDRVFLNEDSWAYSEAQYDDQAISFFPDERLLMLPFTTWNWTSPQQIQAMQLISWDDTGLQLRGAIQHLDTPRRGTLLDDAVITISGREVLTTDISDPDLPVEGGKTTLAWNVQSLIPHDSYLLQLETSSSDWYGRWMWENPFGLGVDADPVLYVTSMDQPNVPAAEVVLEPGHIIGAVKRDQQLVLLQDISVFESISWEIPAQQSLAVRVYDLTDPLSPVLLDEDFLEDIDYLGDAYEGHLLPDGSILWSSKVSYFYGFYFLDIWPGPWLYEQTLSYLVSTLDSTGKVDFSTWKVYHSNDGWGSTSPWLWEDPLLVSSMTDYIERERPDGPSEFEARVRLVAVDFSDPAAPAELPGAKLPANLVAIESLQDGINHYLYFEPNWNAVEVWGWDETAIFNLFKQALYPEQGNHSSTYSDAWMPPFHVRHRTDTDNGSSTSILDIWRHDFPGNKFDRIEEFSFEDRWLSRSAVKEPWYLQSTDDAIHFFKADAASGTFEQVESVNREFPNVYGLQLDEAVMLPDTTLIPAGMYGVEAVPVGTPVRSSRQTGQQLVDSSAWLVLDASQWERVAGEATDAAGLIRDLKWIYYPDHMQEIDPQAEDAGDFWRKSDWFGWYVHDPVETHWIHHLEHGNLYAYESDSVETEGLYLLDAGIGLFWTHAETYPWIYAYDRSEWLYYLKGSGANGRRWFFGLNSGWF